MKTRQRVGAALASLGVAVLLVELLRYWIKDRAIHGWPVVLGCLFAFVGFYSLDPTGSKDAGEFIEGFTVRVLGVLRSGRRSTDMKVVADVAPVDPESDPEGRQP